MSETVERPGIVRGQVHLEVTIPAREYIAIELKQGQVLRIIDVEGQQVADLACFSLHNFNEMLNCCNSKLLNKTWKLTTGHSLYSNECSKMLTIIEDTVGLHDATGGYCQDETNFARFGVRGTRNCRDNLTLALAPWGIRKHEIPGCFCAFMNMVYEPDGTMEIRLPASKAGDYIDMQAEMDLLVGISNCPQERNPCNGFNPTPLKLVVFDIS